MRKKLQTIGKSKGIILDKQLLRLLGIEDEVNDEIVIEVFGDSAMISKYEKKEGNTKRAV